MADHLDLTWRAVGVIVAGVGVGSAILTHILTIAKVRKDLVDYPKLKETLAGCKKVCDLAMSKLENKQTMTLKALKQEHSFCSGTVADKFEEQKTVLEEHTKLLNQGEDEFTALRLNFGVLIDALDISDKKRKEARERMENIRETVLNNRKP
jgi:hypothetical protein